MTKDRLADLQAGLKNDDEDVSLPVKIEVQEESFEFMDGFLQEVEIIWQNIETIEVYMEDIKKVHSLIIQSPQVDQKVKQQLEELMSAIKLTANKVRVKLKNIGQIMDQDELDYNSSATLRIRQTQYTTLSTTFAKVMAEYNNTQTDFRERCKIRIQRQLEITGRKVASEELENMLECGNPSVFTQGIIIETQQARQSLADIEASHADIIKLEKSIKELHDMFMDMATLVETQGEMIDRIEYNVENAVENVGQASNSFRKAQEYKSKTRMKKIMALICVGVVILLIALIIGLSVGL
ncbi:Syntaxin-1A [Chamberlinius hualienensis]